VSVQGNHRARSHLCPPAPRRTLSVICFQNLYVIALVFAGLAAADVTHLKLGQSADGGYGFSSSASSVVPGGDSSSHQPAEYTPEHLKVAEIIPGGDSSSYQPAEYTSAYLKQSSGASVASVASVAAEVVPGGDSSSYQPAEYTPEYLKTSSVASEATAVVPGGDSSSYQPAEYTPAHLKTAVPAAIGADTVAPVPEAIGADTYTPEKFIPKDVQQAHYKYVQEQEQQQVVVPGGDSSSYQPEYTPEYLKTSSVASEAAAVVVVPGGDSSSYQPAEYTPAHLKTAVPAAIGADTVAPVPEAIGADTYTPEKFIPKDVQQAHYKYVQEQEQEQQQVVVPGGDSSSYQPAEYTPANLKTTEQVVVPGGDSSSYQPAEYTPAHLKTAVPAAIGADTVAPVPEAIGADTYTPEKFIPEDVQQAHYKYVQEQEQQQVVVPGGDSSSYQPAEYTPASLKKSVAPAVSAAAEVVPGGDSSSYQPAEYTPAHLKPVVQTGSYTQTQAQTVVQPNLVAAYVQGQLASISQELQAPVVIGTNTVTPAHLYEEPASNGIEEFNPETHVPVVIGRDTITPAHLVKTSQGTQYAANGGYVY
ncbi:hypothetical protein KR018_003915, partial [Drosophila ironensis]